MLYRWPGTGRSPPARPLPGSGTERTCREFECELGGLLHAQHRNGDAHQLGASLNILGSPFTAAPLRLTSRPPPACSRPPRHGPPLLAAPAPAPLPLPAGRHLCSYSQPGTSWLSDPAASNTFTNTRMRDSSTHAEETVEGRQRPSTGDGRAPPAPAPRCSAPQHLRGGPPVPLAHARTRAAGTERIGLGPRPSRWCRPRVPSLRGPPCPA